MTQDHSFLLVILIDSYCCIFYDEFKEMSDKNEIKRRTKSLLFDWWFC